MTAPIIHEDERIVVRGHWREGEFFVYVHPRVGDSEVVPRGYWLGSNALAFVPIKELK